MAIVRWSPHSITLRQLQYVAAVAETRSFHRAAGLCRVAQPSLSSQVAQVERALGVTLFERSRRRVLVTAAGEALLARARPLLVAADDLVDAAARLGDPLAGTLRIGVLPTISPYFVPALAPALRRAFAELTVQWSEERTAALVAALQAGELDAALVALESELGDVAHEVVGRDPFVLAAAPSHPLARASRPLHARELDGVDLLVLQEGHCLRDQALAACARARGAAFAATSLPTLVQMVAGSGGVTLLPELALATEARRARLRLRRFVRPAPGRTLAVVWRRGAAAAAGLHRLAAVARTVFDRLQRR